MASRLIIVGGPNQGAAYFLKEGSNSIGRESGNDITLSSGQVSKRHCVLSVLGAKVEVLDAGSSNGTFVNGILIKKKVLRSGDKISIGPFVFEFLQEGGANVGAHAGAESPASVDFDMNGSVGADAGATNDLLSAQLKTGKSEKEKSIFKKLFSRFDEVVSPVLYDWNTRNEWWYMVSILFVGYVILYIGMSVYPLLETAKESVLEEAEDRAKYIARQIGDINRDAIERGSEVDLNVDFAEKDPSVIEALILDLNGRVLAPGVKINEGNTNPYVTKVLRAIRNGNRKSWVLVTKRNEDSTRLLVTVPVFVRSPNSGSEVPKALVVLKFRLNRISLGPNTIGIVYMESFLIALFLGAIFIFLVFRLTYKPIDTVNDELDEVLKGNAPSIQKRYQFEPLNNLIDSVNSVLSRVPELRSREEDEVVEATDTEQQIIDNMLVPVQYMVTNAHIPMLLMDSQSNIVTMSASFEELSGMHREAVAGNQISEMARDEAFASMMHDMMEKAPEYGPEGVREDYEFSAGLYNIICLSINSLPDKIEGYLVSATPSDEEDYG